MLPAYSLMLGLLALVGFMAIAIGVQTMPEFADGFKRYTNNFSVPALFLALFPSWFVGVAFAAIAIGALVPAAIMSIATANTFTRNIYREFINPRLHRRAGKPGGEDRVAGDQGRRAGVHLRPAAAIRAVAAVARRGVDHPDRRRRSILGLYTRFFNGWALLLGWVVGFGLGTWMVASNNFAPVYPLHLFGVGFPCYVALASLVVNMAVAFVVSLYLNRVASDRDQDVTVAGGLRVVPPHRASGRSQDYGPAGVRPIRAVSAVPEAHVGATTRGSDRVWTAEEFLATDQCEFGDAWRYELVDGVIVAHAAPTPDHGAIVAALNAALGARLVGRPNGCRPESGSGAAPKHQQPATARIPDAMIRCREHPRVTFDVVSPSELRAWRVRDRRRQHLQHIECVQEIVEIYQDEAAIHIYRRDAEGKWPFSAVNGLDAVLTLESVGLDIPLAEIYQFVSVAE